MLESLTLKVKTNAERQRNSMLERGSWQKVFVKKLVDQGVSHDYAMMAMGLACEERQTSYIEGYNKGFNDGTKHKEI